MGAWLVFEDESGQGLRPPKGRTWGRRGHTPVVKVTGGSNRRISLAALIAVKPGCQPRVLAVGLAGQDGSCGGAATASLTGTGGSIALVLAAGRQATLAILRILSNSGW